MLKKGSSIIKSAVVALEKTSLRGYAGLGRYQDWGGKGINANEDFNFQMTQKESNKRAFFLYRALLKQTVWIKAYYRLPIEEEVIQARVRKEFNNCKTLKDPYVIEALLRQGYITYYETLKKHVQRGKILSYFTDADYTEGILPNHTKMYYDHIVTDSKNMDKEIRRPKPVEEMDEEEKLFEQIQQSAMLEDFDDDDDENYVMDDKKPEKTYERIVL
mmetsp:Transcript_8411/g.12435  ORF Transcript_8411/g.12435 Transcript_8411/m.12435 type:complete len:217 (+) Transcript_8411:40-690(+)